MLNVSELEVMVDKNIVKMVKELKWHDFRILKSYEERWNKLDVEYNFDLRSTLGRFAYNNSTGLYIIEINPECPEENLEDTVQHEVLHMLTGLRDTKKFKHICETLGVKFRHNVDLEDAEDYKYKLTCDDCGEVVAKRKRKCKLTKHPEHYKSSCCSSELNVEKT